MSLANRPKGLKVTLIVFGTACLSYLAKFGH